MTNRFDLPDIEFFNKAPEQILADMLFHISEKTGLEFRRADPRRKFVEGLAMFVALERNKAEHELKQNLLAYAEDIALDHKGVDLATTRLPATAASTTIRFKLEIDRPVALVIPAGTRALVAETYFATQETAVVPLGVNEIDITMYCESEGDIGNGYLAGEITTLVDPLPYVNAITNITETSGGADEESDDAYAERIRLAPEKFSVAGPELAYKYYALTASQEIIDAEVFSPAPGVTQIVALLQNGQLPTEEHLNKILEICSASDVRPLTDNVIATIPSIVEYTMEVEYWIATSKSTQANVIMQKVEANYNDFILWQRSKLGRDVNGSELTARLRDAGAARIKIIGDQYIELSKTQIAQETNMTLVFKGLTDD